MTKRLKTIIIAVVIASLSFFGAARIFSTPASHETSIKYLDEKKVSVLELAGAATASSLALSALHDDVASPIAEELANLSRYFLLIVSAIVLEKSLLTVTGHIAFRWIIPVACLIYVIFAFNENESFKKLAIKLAAFGLAIFLIVPASVSLSMKIEEALDYTASASVDTTDEDTASKEDKTEDSKDGKWWQNILDKASDAAEKLKDNIVEGIDSAKEKAGALVNRFIDALAVLIVTACVIPILVLLSFLWIIKLLFNSDANIPSVGTVFDKVRKKQKVMSEE